MNEEPAKLLLRRGDVLRWTGLAESAFDKLVTSHVVTGFAVRPGGRRFYHKEQIRQKIINKVKGN